MEWHEGGVSAGNNLNATADVYCVVHAVEQGRLATSMCQCSHTEEGCKDAGGRLNWIRQGSSNRGSWHASKPSTPSPPALCKPCLRCAVPVWGCVGPQVGNVPAVRDISQEWAAGGDGFRRWKSQKQKAMLSSLNVNRDTASITSSSLPCCEEHVTGEVDVIMGQPLSHLNPARLLTLLGWGVRV